MSYHTLNNNYLTTSPILLPDPFSMIDKPNINIYNNKNSTKQYPTDKYNFESSKAFINQEKQWLNSFKINQIQLVNSSTGKTVEKPKTSSLADQRKNYLENNGILQENLIKTVKPTNFSYRKPYPQVNPESFKQLSFPFLQVQQPPSYTTPLNTDRIKQSPRNLILSIDQIRQIEKIQLDQKIVHKITSSSSRQKLKTSSSKDSKRSVNIERKSINLNGNTQRYNKYINDGLIILNIDLKKEINKNIITPNLNVRKFGQSSGYIGQPVQNHQRFGSDLTQISKETNQKQQMYVSQASKIYSQKNNPSQNQSLTQRQSVPCQDQNLNNKLKNRSKSNLSKFTQLRQSAHRETFHFNPCQNQTLQKPNNIEIQTFQTPQKINQSEKHYSTQNNQRKIHPLSYSSTKHKIQNNIQKQKFSQKSQILYQSNQKVKQNQLKQIDNKRPQNSEIYINQQKKYQGSRTQRMIIRKDDQEDKIKRQPIRLTLQKRL